MANSPLIGDGALGLADGSSWAQTKPEKAPSGHGSGTARTATRVLGSRSGILLDDAAFPLLAGREFDERDRMGSPPVAIVNEAWVKVNLAGR